MMNEVMMDQHIPFYKPNKKNEELEDDDQLISQTKHPVNVAHSWTASWALQVRRRLPEFAPAKVLDFGAGPSSALW
jgi:ribosomal protein RSM22 (predicted rRNA methylase)